MTAQTITEYAVKGTVPGHGKYKLTVEAHPTRKTDREWNVQAVASLAKRQADWGITPDAELVTRTVTVSDWDSELAGETIPTPESTSTQILVSVKGLSKQMEDAVSVDGVSVVDATAGLLDLNEALLRLNKALRTVAAEAHAQATASGDMTPAYLAEEARAAADHLAQAAAKLLDADHYASRLRIASE